MNDAPNVTFTDFFKRLVGVDLQPWQKTIIEQIERAPPGARFLVTLPIRGGRRVTRIPIMEKCKTCGGRGTVADIDGNARPCSRCKGSDFDKWAAARRPKKPPLIVVDELSDFDPELLKGGPK